ncbi:hypothetical protein FT663_05224 [Candidozyma haemuli var. vulneris]|uniref:Peptidase M20 dimerisation domain-containing protein n=1 Tax=Candidozyma haemuli TaxID=45357 RepID=A0A2V1AT35_9ASCO|nr:hypothetical protein CXQ85_000220 [[Candida] haemuloni]KAF3985628.1 hypothetical protein FT663_05224 [[Candida] haemuloni var. vulneris]KAF3992667.1 hypothetical protein FT662_01048 [[Candida] haemuloni var. vulneris]PVH21250.1 hypothetical protein CXQ85_000220 [[Candida] haemuloni]
MIGLPDDNKKRSKKYGIGAIAAVLVVALLFCTNLFSYIRIAITSSESDVCPIIDIYRPKSFYKDNSTVHDIIFGKKFRKESAEKMTKAVQVDTQIYDDPPAVDDDPEYWKKFIKFHEYLEETFPTVYENLEVTKVNTYGLVFYWKGTNPDLKPLMLAAHQDVVPVQEDTVGDWTYPPFSGHFDGENLYGRGSVDCKNVLVSIMETFELLLSKNFTPERGVIAAFGMDEEVSGWHGAESIAHYLEKRFGKNSIYGIIDEGAGIATSPFTGGLVAMIGTGEKGYVDVDVFLTTPGGHSSMPPDYTSIGIVSELAYAIEQDPFKPLLSEKNPTLGLLQCSAAHDHQGNLPKLLKKSILRAGYDKVANSIVVKALAKHIASRYLIQTSQAMDIIKGGEKNNALPESVRLLVNHRVAIETEIDEVLKQFTDRVIRVAKKHDIGLIAFGEELLEPTAKGSFVLKVSGKITNTAPVTPKEDTLWNFIGGVTRHIFEDYVFTDLKDPIVVAPSIMTGNTDTRHYWNLTDHIYRYSPMHYEDPIKDTKIHSVDEHLLYDNHLHMIAFFYEFIQSIQEHNSDA